MKCKLCNKDKKLIRKSHILPDFLFKKVYSDKHQLLNINYNSNKFNDRKVHQTPTAPYEERLLCENCDNQIIGGLEGYFSKYFFRTEKHGIKHKSSNFYWALYKNLNHNYVNLFLISLLWRSHISNHPSFKSVKINDELVEKMRKAILYQDNKPNWPVISAIKLESNSDIKNFITNFVLKQNTYLIVIEGFIMFFHVGEDELYNKLKNHVMNPNGEWYLPILPKEEVDEFFINSLDMR